MTLPLFSFHTIALNRALFLNISRKTENDNFCSRFSLSISTIFSKFPLFTLILKEKWPKDHFIISKNTESIPGLRLLRDRVSQYDPYVIFLHPPEYSQLRLPVSVVMDPRKNPAL